MKDDHRRTPAAPDPFFRDKNFELFARCSQGLPIELLKELRLPGPRISATLGLALAMIGSQCASWQKKQKRRRLAKVQSNWPIACAHD
jgi:hypothetical protein